MDRGAFWLQLFTIGYAISMCMAGPLTCPWENLKKCPAGEYPENPCTSTECVKCTATVTDSSSWCYCNPDKPLCSNDKCHNCLPRLRCSKGEQFKRTGTFTFNYVCERCPNNTYYSFEDDKCMATTDCAKHDMIALFPGNSTHNAICGVPHTKVEDSLTHTILVVCLSITTFICLTLLIMVCVQRAVAKNGFSAERHSRIHSVKSCNESSCKLSKEEMGYEHNPPDCCDISSEFSTLQCEV